MVQTSQEQAHLSELIIYVSFVPNVWDLGRHCLILRLLPSLTLHTTQVSRIAHETHTYACTANLTQLQVHLVRLAIPCSASIPSLT